MNIVDQILSLPGRQAHSPTTIIQDALAFVEYSVFELSCETGVLIKTPVGWVLCRVRENDTILFDQIAVGGTKPTHRTSFIMRAEDLRGLSRALKNAPRKRRLSVPKELN